LIPSLLLSTLAFAIPRWRQKYILTLGSRQQYPRHPILCFRWENYPGPRATERGVIFEETTGCCSREIEAWCRLWKATSRYTNRVDTTCKLRRISTWSGLKGELWLII
jgi:hypothetical protein